MSEVEKWKQALVLKQQSNQVMLFAFQGKMWAIITLSFAGFLSLGAFFYWKANSSLLLPGIALFMDTLFVYSAVYSLSAVRQLTINGFTKEIRYIDKTIRKKDDLCTPFDEIKEILIFQPMCMESHLKAKNYFVQLVLKNGRFFNLGDHAFGAFNLEKAELLADKIASIVKKEIRVE